MKSVCFAALLALALASSCSAPQCGENQRLIGNTCRSIPKGDAATEEEPGTATASDASAVADANMDAASPDQSDGASLPLADASSADVDVDSSTALPPASAMCGDGILNGTELCDPKVAAGQPGACPTADSCKSTDSCLVARVVGDPAACNARCETEPRRQCANDDECCPSGCTSGDDNDCSATCGNHFVDANEACEVGVAQGCPTTCPAPTSCNATMLTGDPKACSARCVPFTITTPSLSADDHCCPAGANANTDKDCTPVCPNGVKEAGEICDGNCPTTCPADGNACTDDKPQGSGCALTCSYPAITAPKADGCCVAGETYPTEAACPGCGNGKVEAGEQCDDGSVAGGDGCASCQWENLASIPGDERPGYILCGNMSCSQMSSGVRQYCLRDANKAYRCGPYSAGDKAECDGPEDCPVNNSCVRAETEETSYFCVAKSEVTGPLGYYYSVYCHSTADCVGTTTCKFAPGITDFTGYGGCE